jgi:hypothetical protein
MTLPHFQTRLTKLSCQLSIDSGAGPVVRPSNISVLAQSNHGLNGEGHSGLALSNSLVLGVVRDVGRTMEKLADSVATVSSDNAAVVLLGMLLNNVTKFSDQSAGLNGLDRLIQALSCRLNHTNSIGVGLGLVSNVISLVQIGVVSFMVQGNIDVENIAIKQNALVRNTVADDFVNGRAARLGEVVVVQRRGVGLGRVSHHR